MTLPVLLAAVLAAAVTVISAAAPPDHAAVPPPTADVLPTVSAGDLVLLLLAVAAFGLILWRRLYRLTRVPRRPILFEPPFALGLIVLMFLASIVGYRLAALGFRITLPTTAEELADLPMADTARLTLGASVMQLLVALFYLSRVGTARLSDDRRPRRPAAAIIGAGAVLLTWPILIAVSAIGAMIITLVTGSEPDPIAHDTLRQMQQEGSGRWFLLMVLLVTVAGPIIEEVMYRGLLQDAIRRLGVKRWPAIAITSLLFALMHWSVSAPHAVAALFVLSLAFGWAYERTGRLTAPITMHIIFNAGNLILALLT